MSGLRPEDLDDLLARHGATPDRWPESEREATLALVREDPGARSDWHDALDLEDALDDWTVPEPAADLAARIAAAAPERNTFGDVLAHPGMRLWQGALLATIPVLLGFLIAVTQVQPQPERPATTVQAGTELAWVSSYGLLGPRPDTAQ